MSLYYITLHHMSSHVILSQQSKTMAGIELHPIVSYRIVSHRIASYRMRKERLKYVYIHIYPFLHFRSFRPIIPLFLLFFLFSVIFFSSFSFDTFVRLISLSWYIISYSILSYIAPFLITSWSYLGRSFIR